MEALRLLKVLFFKLSKILEKKLKIQSFITPVIFRLGELLYIICSTVQVKYRKEGCVQNFPKSKIKGSR